MLHPITVIETISTAFMVMFLFGVAFIVPKRSRKIGLLLAATVTFSMGLFFAVRPLWIDYRVGIKTEQLNQYLAEKYPNETWEIRRKEGRQFNPYHLDVKFENEPEWIYTYFVKDLRISQLGLSVPNEQMPNEGKHYESRK
ncbi:hypothetical protein [Neobacillus niacini]|uniref:hypothetical protein n=1 Tax=Neobacillus niacini TaxID=86668 RepID=UPI0021CB04CA|nr:hypothetical protein [Neobacillus niacini]MCM3765162.1 hypothetical protein [Neobacillus niacini]